MIKEQTRKYVGKYFDENEKQKEGLATLCVALAESMLLEQGISTSIVQAEQLKRKLLENPTAADQDKKAAVWAELNRQNYDANQN